MLLGPQASYQRLLFYLALLSYQIQVSFYELFTFTPSGSWNLDISSAKKKKTEK